MLEDPTPTLNPLIPTLNPTLNPLKTPIIKLVLLISLVVTIPTSALTPTTPIVSTLALAELTPLPIPKIATLSPATYIPTEP